MAEPKFADVFEIAKKFEYAKQLHQKKSNDENKSEIPHSKMKEDNSVGGLLQVPSMSKEKSIGLNTFDRKASNIMKELESQEEEVLKLLMKQMKSSASFSRALSTTVKETVSSSEDEEESEDGNEDDNPVGGSLQVPSVSKEKSIGLNTFDRKASNIMKELESQEEEVLKLLMKQMKSSASFSRALSTTKNEMESEDEEDSEDENEDE